MTCGGLFLHHLHHISLSVDFVFQGQKTEDYKIFITWYNTTDKADMNK